MITVDKIKGLTAFSKEDEAKFIQRHIVQVARTKIISGYLFQILEQIEEHLEQGYKLQPKSEFNQISPRSNGYLQISLLIPDHLLTDELKVATEAGREEYKAKLDSDKELLLNQLIKEEEEKELQSQAAMQEQRRLDRKKDILSLIK